MLIHAHLHTIAHTPTEGSPTDSEEEAGDHVILNQPTQWSTIFGDQILVVCGDWGPEKERGGEGRGRKSEGRGGGERRGGGNPKQIIEELQPRNIRHFWRLFPVAK